MRRMLATLLFALLSTAAPAESGREILERFVTSTQSWQADFTQDVINDRGEVQSRAAGIFTLLRPGRFRWEYTAPWLQTIVADGERIWLYDVDLEQVTVRAMDGSLSQTPAALLAGDVSALDDVSVVAVRAGDGSVRLELNSVDANSDFESVALNFKDDELRGLELRDKLGQTTRIQFGNAQLNPGLSQSDFDLDIPDTVDVIDETSF